MTKQFDRFARLMSQIIGAWSMFVALWVLLFIWIIWGFWAGFEDLLYQFVGSNFMSFLGLLLLVLLQSSQNRDTEAINAKLDEMIRVHDKADNKLIAMEKAQIKE